MKAIFCYWLAVLLWLAQKAILFVAYFKGVPVHFRHLSFDDVLSADMIAGALIVLSIVILITLVMRDKLGRLPLLFFAYLDLAAGLYVACCALLLESAFFIFAGVLEVSLALFLFRNAAQ